LVNLILCEGAAPKESGDDDDDYGDFEDLQTGEVFSGFSVLVDRILFALRLA
jgi:hypothetical protein